MSETVLNNGDQKERDTNTSGGVLKSNRGAIHINKSLQHSVLVAIVEKQRKE